MQLGGSPHDSDDFHQHPACSRGKNEKLQFVLLKIMCCSAEACRKDVKTYFDFSCEKKPKHYYWCLLALPAVRKENTSVSIQLDDYRLTCEQTACYAYFDFSQAHKSPDSTRPAVPYMSFCTCEEEKLIYTG